MPPTAEALDIAQADFVYDLPLGIDTWWEGWASLRRPAPAARTRPRAVAARPEVLVLDDPLSALDVDTRRSSRTALRRARLHHRAHRAHHQRSCSPTGLPCSNADEITATIGRHIDYAGVRRPLPVRDLQP
jgi:hypothetical protein